MQESFIMRKYNRYSYNGPVMEFDRCIDEHWHGETVATSEEKARTNLIYQFKKSNGKLPSSKISLSGKIKVIY